MKNNIIAWLFLSCNIACLSGCTTHSQGNEQRNQATALPVTQLAVRDTIIHHSYVTDIQALRNVEIRARVPGFLEKIYVDEGQEVKKGQLLFSLNDEEYEAELAKNKARLTSAIADAKGSELEVSRVRLLVGKKVISDTELDVALAKQQAANARIDEAQSAIANANIHLAHAHIKAPFDCIIDRIPLKVGSLIDKGTLLTTVSDVQSVYAYFNVSEIEYLEFIKSRKQASYQPTQMVRLILADGSDYPLEGKIETMEGEFQESTGSIAFRARFDNPDHMLKHRSTGRIRLSNRMQDALLVPQKAVFEIQDRNYVFILDANNQAKMSSFVPKARFSYFYIVDSGLKAGDRVVCEGVQNIRDGQLIQPQMITMDSLYAGSHAQ